MSHSGKPHIKSRFFFLSLLNLILSTYAVGAHEDTVSGTVKDPSGAAVAGAHIEIAGSNLTQPEPGKIFGPRCEGGL
jgi:hypothetical protein